MKTDMRANLAELMRQAGDDAYSLETKSGVPQPTTQRFLSGKHGEPRSSTVRKWAKAYGITESQLRGDVPMGGVAVMEERSAYEVPTDVGFDAAAPLLVLQASIMALIRTMPFEPNLSTILAEEFARARGAIVSHPQTDAEVLTDFDDQAATISECVGLHHGKRS
jgi:transcriptional regulator with XRE-family HTH domain